MRFLSCAANRYVLLYFAKKTTVNKTYFQEAKTVVRANVEITRISIKLVSPMGYLNETSGINAGELKV